MHSVGARRALVGAGLAVAIAGASFSAVLFSGGDSTPAKRVVSHPGGADHDVDVDHVHDDDHHDDDAPAAQLRPPRAGTPTRSGTRARSRPAELPRPSPRPQPVAVAVAVASSARHNGDRAAAGVGGLCENGQLAGFAQAWAEQHGGDGVARPPGHRLDDQRHQLLHHGREHPRGPRRLQARDRWRRRG